MAQRDVHEDTTRGIAPAARDRLWRTTTPAPAVLSTYTAEHHRQRLLNLADCNRAIRGSMRRQLITSYLPGQCVYNLGEYPCRTPWDPDEYDECELDRLRDHGIQLIQVMDEWSDQLRLCGGHKLTAINPGGFHRFVAMAHQRGIKVLAYASSGYFIRSDPDFRQEWSRPHDGFFTGYWNLVRCAPASPDWRAYLLPQMIRILDEFEVDGLYNDWGYVANARKRSQELARDEEPAFDETPGYDGAVADLLQLIYAEVTRRGGIYKLHADYADEPQTDGVRVYDYLWVGENVPNADALREAAKDHAPYVVPCIDMSFADIENDDEPFLHAIPYMQFPLLMAGRPWTGERALVPGVRYSPAPPDADIWKQRCLAAWEYHKAHPDGPHVYGGWDAVPPRPGTQEAHARRLKQYLRLTEEGTWAWLEIGESDLFVGPLPQDTVASVFANREVYLVLANYGRSARRIETTAEYEPVDAPVTAPGTHWELPARSLRILVRRSDDDAVRAPV